jgi:hypothetical protein
MASLLLAIGALMAFAGPASAHHHDFGSDDPAGTISSFDSASGLLTIDLADGGQISGLVTDETRIETASSCHRHGDEGDDERRGRKIALRNHGDGHGRHHGWWHHGDEGSTDDLVTGAVVDDAILFLADGKATFAKVELADSEGDPTTSKVKASKAKR